MTWQAQALDRFIGCMRRVLKPISGVPVLNHGLLIAGTTISLALIAIAMLLWMPILAFALPGKSQFAVDEDSSCIEIAFYWLVAAPTAAFLGWGIIYLVLSAIL